MMNLGQLFKKQQPKYTVFLSSVWGMEGEKRYIYRKKVQLLFLPHVGDVMHVNGFGYKVSKIHHTVWDEEIYVTIYLEDNDTVK